MLAVVDGHQDGDAWLGHRVSASVNRASTAGRRAQGAEAGATPWQHRSAPLDPARKREPRLRRERFDGAADAEGGCAQSARLNRGDAGAA
jgi:hypothetical protein